MNPQKRKKLARLNSLLENQEPAKEVSQQVLEEIIVPEPIAEEKKIELQEVGEQTTTTTTSKRSKKST